MQCLIIFQTNWSGSVVSIGTAAGVSQTPPTAAEGKFSDEDLRKIGQACLEGISKEDIQKGIAQAKNAEYAAKKAESEARVAELQTIMGLAAVNRRKTSSIFSWKK